MKLKLKPNIIIAVIFFLVASILIYRFNSISETAPHKQQPAGEDPIRASANILTNIGAGAGTSLIRLMIARGLDCGSYHCRGEGEDDIFKIDFSQPHEPGYGDNPQFELFHPDGGDMPLPSRERLSKVTNDPRVIFSVSNNILGLGTKASDLVVIIPGVRSEVCDYFTRNVKNPKLNKKQELAKNPFPIIADHIRSIELPIIHNNNAYGCVLADEELFYIHSIFIR